MLYIMRAVPKDVNIIFWANDVWTYFIGFVYGKRVSNILHEMIVVQHSVGE